MSAGVAITMGEAGSDANGENVLFESQYHDADESVGGDTKNPAIVTSYQQLVLEEPADHLRSSDPE